MNPEIDIKKLQDHRKITYRLENLLRLNSLQKAVEFVNECGFVSFWPIRDISLPSLWNATAGDRPVPDNHDDAGHVCWGWKDQALAKRLWYYGRVIRKRNAMISLELLPSFYALSPNYGDPESDLLAEYENGTISRETRTIFYALLNHGPLDSITLKKVSGFSSRESVGTFEKCISLLQSQFRILPIGVAEAGRWSYAFIYGLTHLIFPDIPILAHTITEQKARSNILQKYIQNVGAVSLDQICRLLGWNLIQVHSSIKDVVEKDKHLFIIQHSNLSKTIVSLKSLIV